MEKVTTQQIAEKLRAGKRVVIRVRGTSMYPKLFSGDEVMLAPLKDKTFDCRGQIVFAKSSGRYFLQRLVDTPNSPSKNSGGPSFVGRMPHF